MKIDIQTLSLILCISFILQSITLFILYRQSTGYKGILQWTLGGCLIAVAALSMLLRQMETLRYFAIVLTNVLYFSGFIIVYIGTGRFTEQKTNTKIWVGILIALTALQIYFSYFDDQLNIRSIVFSLATCAIFLATSIKILAYRNRTQDHSSTFAGSVFFMIFIFFLFRTLFIIFSPVKHFFSPTILQSATFISTFIFSVLWTFGLIVLVNQKLYRERLEAKKHFEQIFNSNPDISLIVKIPEQNIVEVNESFAQLTGYTKEEITGKSGINNFTPFYHNVERETMINTLRQYGYCTNIEMSFIRKDQSVFNSLFSARMIEIDERPHAICIIRDITELKNAEKKILISEQKTRALIDNAPIGIFTTSIDGKTISTNPHMAHLLGFETPEEAIAYYNELGAKLYVSSERRKVFIEQLTKHKKVENFEYEAITYDKRRIWLTMSARMVKTETGDVVIEGFTTDVTTRKRNEAELREKEFQYRNLANAGSALIWTATTDKLYTFVNDPWLRFTGRTVDQELGTGWTDNIHPDDLNYCMEEYVDHFDKQEPFQMEYRLRHHTGAYRWISDMGSPNYNSQGQFIGYIGHCFDIDDRKKLEFELIAAKDKAEESDRLKSFFLANLSHEIRTPMNSIMGFASLLPDETNHALTANYANIIVNSSEQLLHIIDNIVLYSKLQTGLIPFHPSKFELTKLLMEVQQTFSFPHDNNIVQLKIVEPEDNHACVISDFEKLRQILSNLVANAFKYTPNGSITLGYRKDENKTILFIADTGIGIQPDEHQKIFERFFRGSNVNKIKISGTGLGLSIVKELVQLLKGTIWVESKINEGSTFFIALPNNPQ